MSVVSVNGLSKQYILEDGGREFHALKSISFELKEGESVGIIGANGAGKSTLLKLLSGVTLPTAGEGKITGTFSSLLEVGTGFHADLSGRDNIFLNASILGVSRKDVEAELAAIIAFSGVEQFIDQPLRTYSSGMKLRLAFAVMAHLKTDIIALDEVLTVGDSMFQIKCMERIFEFKDQGRTILFVSHNLSAVKKLCERTLVLNNGELVFDGPTEDAVRFYMEKSRPVKDTFHSDFVKEISVISIETEAVVELQLQNLTSASELDLGINILTQEGMPLYHFSNRFIGRTLIPKEGKLKLKLTFKHGLKSGNYPISIYLGQQEKRLLWQENAANLNVPPYNPYGFHNPDAIQGPIISDFEITES